MATSSVPVAMAVTMATAHGALTVDGDEQLAPAPVPQHDESTTS